MKRGWLWLGLWIALLSAGSAQAVPRSVEAIPRSTERITLFWLPPRGESPSAYRVFLDGAPVAEVGGAVKSYDFTGLSAGREYRLAVQAVYPDGRVSEPVERVDRAYRALPRRRATRFWWWAARRRASARQSPPRAWASRSP